MSFKEFMKQVDKHVASFCGLTSADLPDMDFHSRWEDECSPREVAIELLEEEGFPEELLDF